MNSDVIKLLPDSVANQIAAGEVIQRPASVIKELVENSVDAGAKSITIVIKDAGRTLIQVIDDGCGLSPVDARMAFERHATSKIRNASDIYGLHTMGFRGEALPSIAAVAQIDLCSMRRGDTVGTRVRLSASRFESQEPEACAPGTNIMVRNIFFNLPARRKFLKKDSVELSHIMHEFERLALVNPSIEFSLTHNDTLLHKLTPGSLKQRISELFGKAMAHQIIPVATETSIIRIDGFVGLPQNARRRGAQQFFFINGRNMRHPYFHKAVMECYSELIGPDTQPSYFINFTADPETIDVNIHPQKHEIKFENELPIWKILVAAVKEALGKFNAVPAIDFDTTDAPDIPVFMPDAPADMPEVDFDESYNPFTDTPADAQAAPAEAGSGPIIASHFNSGQRSTPMHDWEKLYESFSREKAAGLESVKGSALNDLPDSGEIDLSAASLDIDMPESRPSHCLQLHNRFIVSVDNDSIVVVDQHRAHTASLYRSFLDSLAAGSVAVQKLMFAEAVTLTPSQNVVMDSIADTLETIGFDIAYLGDTSWSINGAPALLGSCNPSEALLRIIDDCMLTGREAGEQLLDRIALSMARSAAVKNGTVLTQTEMQQLVADATSPGAPTPGGRPAVARIGLDRISSLF